MVPWETLGQPLFDRLINAFVYRKHSDTGDTVEVIEGRGGDGGLDLLVLAAGGRVIVYQLKYFPEGFDGRFGDRRQQITKSFDRAISTRPDLDDAVQYAWGREFPRPNTTLYKATVNKWECGRLFCEVKDRRPVRTIVIKRSAHYLPDDYSLGVITPYCDNPPVNGLKPQMCPWWAKNPGPY